MALNNQEPLRAIGQYLDQLQAEDVELLATELALALRWRQSTGTTESRQFTWDELHQAIGHARRQRRNHLGQMSGQWAPILRTLGQELDSQGIELLQMHTLAGGFQVHGMRQDEPYTQWFALERLREWGLVERTNRVTRMLRPPQPARSPLRALWQRFTAAIPSQRRG